MAGPSRSEGLSEKVTVEYCVGGGDVEVEVKGRLGQEALVSVKDDRML